MSGKGDGGKGLRKGDTERHTKVLRNPGYIYWPTSLEFFVFQNGNKAEISQNMLMLVQSVP